VGVRVSSVVKFCSLSLTLSFSRTSLTTYTHTHTHTPTTPAPPHPTIRQFPAQEVCPSGSNPVGRSILGDYRLCGEWSGGIPVVGQDMPVAYMCVVYCHIICHTYISVPSNYFSFLFFNICICGLFVHCVCVSVIFIRNTCVTCYTTKNVSFFYYSIYYYTYTYIIIKKNPINSYSNPSSISHDHTHTHIHTHTHTYTHTDASVVAKKPSLIINTV